MNHNQRAQIIVRVFVLLGLLLSSLPLPALTPAALAVASPIGSDSAASVPDTSAVASPIGPGDVSVSDALAATTPLGSDSAASIPDASAVTSPIGPGDVSVPKAPDATITVNTLADDASVNGNCTLREAITAANTNVAVDACTAGSAADTITFSVNGTITLTSALPIISDQLTIDGLGHTIMVNGNNLFRVFQVGFGIPASLNNLTIMNGHPFDGSGGGGIYNQGNLTVANSTLSNNVTEPNLYGGGILSNGLLTVTNSAFNTNTANYGGGIFGYGVVAVSLSTFSGNTALDGNGGGLYNFDVLSVVNSTFNGNTATFFGGGIDNLGTLTVTNSAFIDNTANNGGGISNQAGHTLTAINNTFSGNAATGSSYGGGGIHNFGELVVANNAFDSNTAPATGGGISDHGLSTLIVTDTTFTGNTSPGFSDGGGNGGGLYTDNALLLTGTQFLSNTAKYGGGAYAVGAVTLNGGLFQNNVATIASGGGLYANSTLALTDTQFISNTAPNGGGALANGAVTLNGGLFQNNNATSGYYGGGLYAASTLVLTGTQFFSNTAIDGGGAVVFGAATLNNATFLGNTATATAAGGLDSRNDLTVSNSLFQNNACLLASCYQYGGGGAIWAQGTTAIANTRFIGNSSAAGGSALTFAVGDTPIGDVQLINTLFADNSAPVLDLYAAGHQVTVLYSTIASQTLAGGAAISVVSGTVGITDTIITSYATGIEQLGGTVYDDYNYFYGNTANKSGTIGGGTHDVTSGTPNFTNPAGYNYHLLTGSAAINAGVDTGISTDYDGNARPIGGGFDIGYDETAFVPGLSAINSSPTALGQSTHYTATLTNGGNFTYIWNFGDGIVGAASASPTATHTYSGIGNYTTRVTATNSISTVVATTPVTITSAGTPISGLSASNSSPTTLGGSTAFTATISAGTSVTYLWNFGDGSATVAGATASRTYAAAGNYTARVTATNSISSAVATTPVTITNLAPIANAGSNQNAGTNALVTLNGSASSDPDGHLPLTYRWQQTGGAGVVLANSTLSVTTFTTPGTGGVLTFTLTVTDAYGLAGAPAGVSVSVGSSHLITPTAGPNGTITPGTPQTVSYGGSQTFTISANSGYVIADVRVDGVSQGWPSIYTFNNVTADHIITASFQAGSTQTQTVGLISITADQFTNLGGGLTRASGNVRLGQYLFLTGPTDSVLFSSTTVTATGKLSIRSGIKQVDVISGTFVAPGSTGLGVLIGSPTYLLSQVADIPIVASLSVSTIDIPASAVNATANLGVQVYDINATTGVNFAVTGTAFDIVYSGSVGAFSFSLGGLAVNVASGATLSNVGIAVPTATLTLPSVLGGASGAIHNLNINTISVTLGSGTITLPEIKIGDGTKISITNSSAQLMVLNNKYGLTVTSTLNVNLPGNTLNTTLGFIVQNGQITGTVSTLDLTVAGVALALNDVQVSSAGLAVVTATLTLPNVLGGASTTLSNVNVYSTGLSLGGAGITLPQIKIGDGSKISITNSSAQLLLSNNQYNLTVTGTLNLKLPGNALNTTLGFTLQNGQITGTLSTLNLTLSGAMLAMSNVLISNSGLAVGSATLTLPASLGGAITTLTNVSIDATGLQIGSGSIALPEIKIGDGTKVRIVGLTSTLAAGATGYTFNVTGTLWVLNSTSASLSFTINNGQLSGTLNSLNLTVAGSTLALQTVQISNVGLAIGSATLTLPASLGGGATSTLTGVKIDATGLQLGSASIALPVIKIGDGSKVKITNPSAQLTLANNKYSFTINGTLNINLPGSSATAALSFTINEGGQMNGTLSALSLTVAGATLALQNVQLSNSGLAVSQATLTMPPSFGGGASTTLTNVSIDSTGLHLGGGSLTFALPILKIGGDKAMLVGPVDKSKGPNATLSVVGSSYAFGINGTLQLRLPNNSQDIAFSGNINSAGQFSASIPQIALNLAKAALTLNSVVMDNAGLSVATGTLLLPAKFGGVSGSVNNVRIDKNGLSIGGGAVSVAVPNFTVGGFSVTNAQAGFAVINSGKSYRLDLRGTVAINVRGSGASAAGRFSIDDAGNTTGSVDSFSLAIAGLSLSANQVSLRPDGALAVGAAKLVLPGGFGGSADVYNVVVGNSDVSIGGGAFTLPEIRTGGFTLKDMGASLIQIPGGYKISARGFASLPAVGGAGCKGVGVKVTLLYNTILQQTVLTLAPDQVNGLAFESASFNLACTIPIGTTGFNITGISGSVTLSGSSTTVNVGINIAAGRQLGGVAVVSADAQATLKTSPFDLALAGTVKVFVFTVGGANVHLTDRSFSATLYVNMIVVRGNVSINAWSKYGSFHMNGSAYMTVGIQKGAIFSGRILPYPCNCRGRWPWQWRCDTCWKTITVPSSNWDFSNVGVEFGEFTGDRWGVKGKVSLLGYSAGFYVDNKGTLTIGNVDNYRLVQPSQVAEARAKWQAARLSGLAGPDTPYEVDGIQFTDSSIIVNQTLTTTTDAIFALQRNQTVPTLTLMTPAGVEITPGSLPSNVQYVEVLTYTQNFSPTGTFATAQASNAYICAVSNVAAAETAWVYFSHARADLGTVDVLIDGSPAFTNIAFGGQSSKQVVTAGSHTLALVPPGNPGPILYTTVVSITGSSVHRLIVAGDGAQSLTLDMTDDAPPPSGQAQLRFANASPDAANLDVALATDGRLLFTSVPTLSIGSNVTVTLDPGTYSFVLSGVGITPTQITTTLLGDGAYGLVALGRLNGTPALQLVAQTSLPPSAQLRLVNAINGNQLIDLLTDGSPSFQNVPFTASSAYLKFAGSPINLQLTPAGITTTSLLSGSFPVQANADHTFIALGTVTNTEALLLADDNRLPAWGKTRVRFVNASLNSLAVDVVVQGGATWFNNLAYKDASSYLSLDSGTVTLEVRDHATSSLLLTMPGVNFTEGYIYTLFLMGTNGGSPALQLVQQADIATIKDIQSQYIIHQAQAGVWGMKLNGTITTTDQYILTMLGSNPPPTLTVATAALSGTTTLSTTWRMTSDELGTPLSIYANGGPITATVVITNNLGVTTTVVDDLYTGDALATGLTLPADGSLQTRTFDLKQLTSGTYHIWFEADDGRNAPVRRYAPNPIVVNNAASWPLTWAAVLTVTPAFRELGIEWQPLLHPDVDGYRLIVAAPGLTETTVLTVGNSTAAAMTALEPGRPYSLTLEAYDTESGRSSRSQTASAIPDGAPFTWSGPAGVVNLIAGQSQPVTLTVTAAQEPYPGVVSWQVGCVQGTFGQSTVYLPLIMRVSASTSVVAAKAAAQTETCVSNVNGLSVLFNQTFVTPTLAGVPVPVIISATETLPAGDYVVPIIAWGSGVSRTLNVQVQLQTASFTLGAAPNPITLGENQSLNVSMSATGYNGASRPIGLRVENAPIGLLWSLDNDAILPGGNTSLRITDTVLLASGVYPLLLIGDDGLYTAATPITLTVTKPRFNLTAVPARQVAMAGKAVTTSFAVDVTPLDGWSTPVTLTLDLSNTLVNGIVGLSRNPAGGVLTDTLVAAPTDRVYLIAITSADTPQALYVLNIAAQSGGRQAILGVALAVQRISVYLPFVVRLSVQQLKAYLPQLPLVR